MRNIIFLPKQRCLAFWVDMFKKILLVFVILMGATMVSSCSSGKHTVKVVKPKKHWFPYDQAKHHKRKRTKIVRMKS